MSAHVKFSTAPLVKKKSQSPGSEKKALLRRSKDITAITATWKITFMFWMV